MLRKSLNKPVKTMFIKKHIANSKSNSPTLASPISKLTQIGKIPNLCYVNKKTEKHTSINKSSVSPPNSNSLSNSRSTYQRKRIKNQSENQKKYIKLLKNDELQKFKVIDNNCILDIENNKKHNFDCIFKEGEDLSYKKLTELIFNKYNESSNNIIVIQSSLFEEAMNLILSLTSMYSKKVINSQIKIDYVNQDNSFTELSQSEIKSNSSNSNNTIKNKDLSIDLLNSQNTQLKELFIKEKDIIINLSSFQRVKKRYSFIIVLHSINTSSSIIPLSKIEQQCNITSYSFQADIFICPLSMFSMIRKEKTNINDNGSPSMSPKIGSPCHSPLSSSNKDLLISSLTEENKKLKEENEALKLSLNKYKEVLSSIDLMFNNKQLEIILQENKELICINTELNTHYHSVIEHFDKLNSKLNEIDNKVYTFDDSNVDNSLSEIENENKKNFQEFRNQFSNFFSEVSNIPQKIFLGCSFSSSHYDSLKCTLNGYCNFMDDIIDVVIRDINEDKKKTVFAKNYIEVSWINLYYEKLLFELFNHSLYENKRILLNSFLIEQLIQINKELVKENKEIKESLIMNELDSIKEKLQHFDQSIEHYITNLSKEQKNQTEKFGKLLLSLGKNRDKTLMNNSKSIVNKKNNVPSSTNSSTKNSFYGYIKNEESPYIDFDEDSQLTD